MQQTTTDSDPAVGTDGPPPLLAGLAEDRIVDVDVREDLRQGKEPFGRIMEARSALEAGQVMRLRAIFEPVPLYRVLGGQGFDHWTECLAADDWRVWFYKADEMGAGEMGGDADAKGTDSAHATDRAEASTAGGGEDADVDVQILDVRDLEPPEPMVRTLEALETLPPGKTLLQINVREPRFLYPLLEERGFTWEVRRQDEDLVRIFIRRDETTTTGDDMSEQTTQSPAELDVRPIPPRDKHTTIFAVFGALEPGESFILVNDHDPMPLRYQFQFEHEGQFGWEYLEKGPEVWRVEISRT